MSLQQNGNATENGNVVPPAVSINTDKKIKEPIKLILQLIYIVLVFLPVVVWSAIKMFLAKEKSLKGHVALVS